MVGGGETMIYSGTSEIDNLSINTDVTIIGSGAGGAMAASKLVQRGYSVTIVEEGPYVTYKDFDQDETKLIPKLYRRSAGLATDDFSVKILQGSCWGGSTTINWMTSLRTPKYVLKQWADEFGLHGYLPKQMEKYFQSVENRLNIHKIPVEDFNEQNKIILEGNEKLGYQAGSLPNNSKNCIGCGGCGLGCYYDAKQDMRLTYLSDAMDEGAVAYTDTKAENIEYIGKNKQIVTAVMQGSRYGNKDKTLKITSSKTIVSAGAIHTPLLLQKSGLSKSPVLGKFFQIHPVTATFAEFDREINPSYGIPQTAYSKEYIDFDGNGYGWWLEAPDIEPFLTAVNYPLIGKERLEGMKNFSHSSSIIILVRDGANKQSNGEISWKRGLNLQNGNFSWKKLPSIRYSLNEKDKYHLLKGLEHAMEVHFAAGANKVLTLHNKDNVFTSKDQISRIMDLPNGPNQLPLFSAHPMGTARMGKDQGNSVVGPDLQMHHYPGMYIMDGSVLPTALGVNPMVTILSTVSRGIDLSNL